MYELTEDEWNEIRKIAIGLVDSGTAGGNQFKCSVMAFVEWLSNTDEEFAIGVEMNATIH